MNETSSWEAERDAGVRLLALQQPREALGHFARALAPGVSDSALWNATGAALALLGEADRALRCFEEALAADPADVPAVRNFINTLKEQRGAAALLAALYALRERGITSAPLRMALAEAEHHAGSHAAGILELEALVADEPGYAPAWASLGWYLVEAGETERARRVLASGCERHPFEACLARILAEVDPAALSDHALAHFARFVETGGEPNERLEAHLTLARRALFEERYDDAWNHFSRSNAIRRQREVYDGAATVASMHEIERVFDRKFFASNIDANLTDWPVFIFGMPRSGTSLVEQILGAHPQVYAGGELTLLDEIVAGEIEATGSISNAIGIRYGEALNRMAPPLTSHVTDKMPANFRYAGLIARFLPQAKMIHVVRDAVDTCISCFTTNFSADGLTWSLSVDELAQYYLAYERLMRHWNEVLPPGRMIEVRYEELVAEPAAQIRRILDFIGLPWNDACVRFNESKRTVRTASAAQVRKPIYASSIGIAERYGDAIAPLRAALGR